MSKSIETGSANASPPTQGKPAVVASDSSKREALRAKITAGEDRHTQRGLAEQAKAAADGALDYVKANPLKTVAGVAIGALVIGALTRSGRGAGRKAGTFAGAATDTALAYGLGLMETAGHAASKGQDKLADLGDTVGDKAKRWQKTAAREGNELSDYLVKAAKRSGTRAGKTIDELRNRIAS